MSGATPAFAKDETKVCLKRVKGLAIRNRPLALARYDSPRDASLLSDVMELNRKASTPSGVLSGQLR